MSLSYQRPRRSPLTVSRATRVAQLRLSNANGEFIYFIGIHQMTTSISMM